MSSKITHFFASSPAIKKLKVENSKCSDAEAKADSVNSESVDNATIKSSNEEIPDCWTTEQKAEFQKKNEWLLVKNKKIGCKICKEVSSLGAERIKQGMNISKPWVNIQVSYYGKDKKEQMTSLRKKIHEHKTSSAHIAAAKILDSAKEQKLETTFIKAFEHEKEVTCRIFRTVYKVAKKNQAFNDFESEIDLQELNGSDMGQILHSTNACINIANHIASEMKKILFKNIIESNCKVSFMFDESTTISQLSSLIIYVRAMLPDMEEHANFFVDIVELENVTAQGIFHSLMKTLNVYGFNDDYLKINLVAITCDGAAVMLGMKKGVVALIKERYPHILIWHCANHRLELSVGDVVKKDFPEQINHFKSFLDKLYSLYHQSPKNFRELGKVAEDLDKQFFKIGRVLSTRWVASSFRTVSAVWKDYEALVAHFTAAKEDINRDKSDRVMYEGLRKKITSVDFVLDLGLMCDALQELSELSVELQARDITLFKAHSSVLRQIRLFEDRKVNKGPFYREAVQAAENMNFKGVTLENKYSRSTCVTRSLDHNKFYDCLKQRMENRLLSAEEMQIPQWTKVLYPENWPNGVENTVTFGETEVENLCKRLRIPERQVVRSFREFLTEKKMPASLSYLMNTINCIPISTAECERGFSQMNLIMTPTRSSLQTKTLSTLMFIKLNGPPLRAFKSIPYVNSWFLKGRHLATDTKSKKRTREDGSTSLMTPVWKLL